MSVAGPLFSAHLIEEGLIATLRTWLPSYAADVAEQHGIDLPEIASWGLASEYERWPEQGLPALITACPGVIGTPDRTSGGFYRATWQAEVSITVSAPSVVTSRRIAQCYAAAIRGALLQRRSLGDDCRIATWTDEAYADIPSEKRRSLTAAANVFTVEQDNVVSWRLGPGSDEPPIPAAWPAADNDPEIETEIE